MPLHFQSLRSGSSGNCLMLWTHRTRILIDCGIPAQYRCRAILEAHAGDPTRIDGVVVSHAHVDHVRYDSLRVLEDCRIPVYCHEACLPQIYERHRAGECGGLQFNTFSTRPFTIQDLVIEPFRVSHHPDFPTHGFVIRWKDRTRERKTVLATDFNDYAGLLEHFANADLIFVEANHDPDLLRKRFNPNSLFHMENAKTGWLLSHALESSTSLPSAVMLGHLSEERNSMEIALETVWEVLSKQHSVENLNLSAAPRYEASRTIRITD